MKTVIASLLVIAPSLLMSACSKPAEGPAPGEAPANEAAAPAAAAASGSGTGTVTAVDPKAGKITLDHGAIAEVGWPAMTMAFAADPALLESVKVGDQVRFDMTMAGGTPTVTAIRRK